MPFELPIGRYAAEFAVQRSPRFSEFTGSAWRGALGHALKRLACVTQVSQCTDCLLYRSCAYPYLFDTPPAADAEQMRRYQNVPHPYILLPIGTTDHQNYRLQFSLIGEAHRQLPLFIMALAQAAQSSAGIAGGKLKLLQIQQQLGWNDESPWVTIYTPDTSLQAQTPSPKPNIPRPPTEIVIHLMTPLRMKRNGRHVGPQNARFADIFGSLLRRISMLTYHHTGQRLDVDFKALAQSARSIDGINSLQWKDLPRYSHRQGSPMQLGGIVGTMQVQDAALAPFWPYLWYGQWLHAGSGTTMGLGHYRLLASLPQRLGLKSTVILHPCSDMAALDPQPPPGDLA